MTAILIKSGFHRAITVIGVPALNDFDDVVQEVIVYLSRAESVGRKRDWNVVDRKGRDLAAL